MTGITIEDLGISKEDLAERVVDRLASDIMHERVNGPDEGDEAYLDTAFNKRVQERVKERIDEAIDNIAAKHVLPNIEAYLENFCLQETTAWGEKKGEPVTFIQYLIQRAEAWIKEPVNHVGKTKGEDSYSWSAKTTRVAYMIDKHLQYSIQTAMEGALKDANSAIAGGIEQAIRIKLQEVLAKVKVTATTGR